MIAPFSAAAGRLDAFYFFHLLLWNSVCDMCSCGSGCGHVSRERFAGPGSTTYWHS